MYLINLMKFLLFPLFLIFNLDLLTDYQLLFAGSCYSLVNLLRFIIKYFLLELNTLKVVFLKSLGIIAWLFSIHRIIIHFFFINPITILFKKINSYYLFWKKKAMLFFMENNLEISDLNLLKKIKSEDELFEIWISCSDSNLFKEKLIELLLIKKKALELEKQKTVNMDSSFFDFSSFTSFITEHKTLLVGVTTMFFFFFGYQLIIKYFQNNNKINSIEINSITTLNTTQQELVVNQSNALVPQLLTQEYSTLNNNFQFENINILGKIIRMLIILKREIIAIVLKGNEVFATQRVINTESQERMDFHHARINELMERGDAQQQVITHILANLDNQG